MVDETVVTPWWRRVIDRVLYEPVLVVALILAVGNLIGEDFTDEAAVVESALVLVGGVVARHFVSPTRPLGGG